MSLRLRDMIAALAIILLTRVAYDDPSESLTATVQLSFYVGREQTQQQQEQEQNDGSATSLSSNKRRMMMHQNNNNNKKKKKKKNNNNKIHRLALAPVVLDVDGDGTVEALASVLHDPKSDTWKLEVLDLKPATFADKTHMAPFHPKTLYVSDAIDFPKNDSGGSLVIQNTADTPLIPIYMVTGHVLLDKDGDDQRRSSDYKPPLTETHYKNTELSDRNRHYFCGIDWHDASQQCGTPCPEGTAGECPTGQQCYADTPCDIVPWLQNKYITNKAQQTTESVVWSIKDLLVTPAGGLPSIFSLWSNGVLVMHSLTGDFSSDNNSTNTSASTSTSASASSSRTRRSKIKDLLQIRKMWQVRLTDDSDDNNSVSVSDNNKKQTKEIIPDEWTGVSVTYVDATDASDSSGMVLVQAHLTYYEKNDDDEEEQEREFIMAFDAETGHKLWDVSVDSIDDDEDEDEDDNKKPQDTIPLPVQAEDLTQSSSARRLSLKPYVQQQQQQQQYQGGGRNSQQGNMMVSNCLHAYRWSLLNSGILPYLYWGETDSANYVLHFEQQQHNQHAIQRMNNHKNNKRRVATTTAAAITNNGGTSSNNGKDTTATAGKSWKNALFPFDRKQRRARKRRSHSHPIRGKPNVVVSKSDRGLQVRSLKNGRSVCHLSLWYDTLYTDLNNDGVLDAVFAVTGEQPVYDDDKYELNEDAKWVAKIASRLKDARMLAATTTDEEEEGEERKGKNSPFRTLCHLMALSGIPPKEELFTVNICGKDNFNKNDVPDVAPLLAVESWHSGSSSSRGRRRNRQDIIVALNDKTVQRIRGGSSGGGGGRHRLVWQLDGKRHQDFPTWENGYTVLVDRIQVGNAAVPLSARPIVIAGDNSVTLLSPGHGSVLATAAFPQPPIRRPILVDFNGDGTTDIVVLTKDAVWGYRVTVRTGSSIFFRIAVGLLVVGLLLAVLRNQFGPHPGRRATDA